jgi:biopolymer transport protein ExbB/TolQ
VQAKRREQTFASNTVRVAPEANKASQSRRRWWLKTNSTPDRLRLTAIVVVLVLVGVGAISWILTDRLVSQTEEVATSTGEVLIGTQQVSASLAEADAAAVSVHLAGADGNREQRRLFEQATDRATSSLERVARLVGDDERSHQALQAIAANMTEYAGLIEAARLGSIEGLDGSDSVLRVASSVNRLEISPDVQLIADRAHARFDEQTGSTWYVAEIILLAVSIAMLVGAQLTLSRRFRRLINVPMVLGTVVMIMLLVVSARGFATQQTSFNNAESQAFDAIQVSEQIQQSAYRHRAISTSAVLVGVAAAGLAELEAALTNEGSGLLDQARVAASSTRELAGADEVVARWDRYVDENARSQAALDRGDLAAAEAITQGSANSAFNGFNTSVESALLDNREQFLRQLQNASDSLQWLRGFILVGSLLAAILAWWGFAQRIGEYR